nr:uncharacterized protein LOC107456061 [Parasteatoda tepidariorum]
MKLKMNLGHVDLSVRFNVCKSTVTNIVMTWIDVLHERLYEPLMSIVPSQLKNQICLPSCFASFQNCRMVVDCTDFCTIRLKKLKHQRLFYSFYKHRHTIKCLIGVAPNGSITFAGHMFPGSTSDKEIFKKGSLCQIFQLGDLVLADKGFLITDVVPDGVSVNIPPFLATQEFTPSHVQNTKMIARARIHVERVIRRIKSF